MGINTNPLKSPKKLLGEEKIIGQKPYRQNIEETRALMVYSGQVVYLLDNYFPPPTQKLIMKITSWNIRGMNSSSKQWMLKSKISRMKEDIILLQETKCDEGNIRRIMKIIWPGCEARWIVVEGASGGVSTLWDQIS
jgi:hypothetical protein